MMKRLKNRPPEERVSVVPERTHAAGSGSRPAAGGNVKAKPARTELESNKWIVEWHNGNKNIVISDTETRQTVYIYKCENSVIQVKGKVNSIAMDGCKKTGLAFEHAIASVEVVNCQSVEVQILGKVPAIAVDKTDGCQLMLSAECLGAEIVTSKVSEMNINLPNPTPGGDPIERPVPEQFKTIIKNGTSLVTEAVQHLG